MKNLKTVVKHIYDYMQDEESKFIFENRLLYSLTEDWQYILNITMKGIRILPNKKELDRVVEFCKSRMNEIVVYGVGSDFQTLYSLYPGFPVKRLCDGDERKQKIGWKGIPVMCPEELLKLKNEVYVAVTPCSSGSEIRHFLQEHGFLKERIIDIGAIMWGGIDVSWHLPQYFDKEIMAPREGEVFIDGGCYDCDTDREFIKWCGGNYKKIYAFEPDLKNYGRCLELCRTENIQNISLYQKGLWSCETELSFQETGNAAARIGEGTVVIQTVAIDAVVGDEPVSFIKMDIEGAELEALRGAEQTIRKNRPRLAICIYHKPEDVIEIPEYILSLHSDYKLYMRHYSPNDCETVLYAV